MKNLDQSISVDPEYKDDPSVELQMLRGVQDTGDGSFI